MLSSKTILGKLIHIQPNEDHHFSSVFPTLFRKSWPARALAGEVSVIDSDIVQHKYVALREAAPRRSQSGKSYFVDHSGIASAKGSSNRLEEHYALGLFNLKREWPCEHGGSFRIVDYQVPLKARQSDKGIGKIDLLGVTKKGRLVVIELKVESQSGGKSDAPPSAVMEGLRYAAMIEADIEAIALEAESRFGMGISRLPPIVQILAPRSWWRRWLSIKAAGNWSQELAALAAAIEEKCGVPFEFTQLDDVEVTYGVDGAKPQLKPAPQMRPVYLQSESPLEGL